MQNQWERKSPGRWTNFEKKPFVPTNRGLTTARFMGFVIGPLKTSGGTRSRRSNPHTPCLRGPRPLYQKLSPETINVRLAKEQRELPISSNAT